MSTWDRAKSIRAGFKPLEALAFDVLEWQPFRVVRNGTEDQIQAFELRLSCLPAKILLGEAQQGLVANQKAFLQDRFRTYFRIKLFMPRPGGGTFIDGNAVRTCFQRPATFACLIDFPEDLVRDFYTLLTAVISGADVKPDQFRELANSWLDRFHGNPAIRDVP